MITEDIFTEMALSFTETKMERRGEVIRYLVCNKKFASIRFCKNRASVKLTLLDQDVFCSYNLEVMYPIPNVGGKHGWTHINLTNTPMEMCQDALTMAYCNVAPARLAALYAYKDL
jgi:hypothetical protein